MIFRTPVQDNALTFWPTVKLSYAGWCQSKHLANKPWLFSMTLRLRQSNKSAKNSAKPSANSSAERSADRSAKHSENHSADRSAGHQCLSPLPRITSYPMIRRCSKFPLERCLYHLPAISVSNNPPINRKSVSHIRNDMSCDYYFL